MFEHEVETLLIHECHDELDYKGTINQHLQNILLPHNSISFLFPDQVCLVQLLNCHKLVALLMQGEVDLPKGPLSNVLVEFEVLYRNPF